METSQTALPDQDATVAILDVGPMDDGVKQEA